jgi:SAM-dependent methyltransferase
MRLPGSDRYIRYLTAKRTVDDRALNRQVYERLTGLTAPWQAARALRVLEVGCGTGAMAARLLAWGLLRRARYLGVDLSAAHLAAARELLPAWASELGLTSGETSSGNLVLEGPGQRLEAAFLAADVLDFLTRGESREHYDLVVAHAFLDLVNLEAVVPRLLACLATGGAFYFTLNFDGATTFWPPLDPTLDAGIEAHYHQSMDDRRVAGAATGGSHTGRRLFSLLPRCGGRLLAAGASDWVVFAGPGGYPHDEEFFLEAILSMVEEALAGRLDRRELTRWVAARRRQLAAGDLVFLAHHLDFCGLKAGSGAYGEYG